MWENIIFLGSVSLTVLMRERRDIKSDKNSNTEPGLWSPRALPVPESGVTAEEY